MNLRKQPLPHRSRPATLAAAVRGALLYLPLASVILSMPLTAIAEQTTNQEFSIAPGNLDAALSQFSRQAGVSVAFDAKLLAGKSTLGLQGAFAPDEALNRLLAGSGLQAERQDRGGYVLVETKSAGTINLDAMRVEDNALGTITEQTKSYTPGTIATATRLVLTPRETPQTVTVVTRQHMDDFNLTNINKVMDHTPGVTRRGTDNYRSYYYARGYEIRNFQYDGIPVLSDGINFMGETTSDMIQYDRVEVIKGASGLTTGAGSPGATINLVRKKPTHEFSGHATAEYGRWDNYRTEWDVGGPLDESGSIRGRFATAFQDQQSYMDHFKEQKRALYGILEVDLSPKTMLTFGGNYDKTIPTGTSWGGTPFFDSHNNEINTSRSFNPGASWSRAEQFSHAFFSQLDHEFDNGWSSRAYYTFQRNAYDANLGSIKYTPDGDTGSSELLSGQYRYKTRSQALEAYARGPFELFGRTHELAVGVSGYHNHLKGSGHNVIRVPVDNIGEWNGRAERPDWGGILYRAEDRINQRAVYASGRFSLSDDLAVILGGRVTNYRRGGDSNMRETGEVIPFAGVTYDLSDNFSLYASYTKIFRPQSVRDESYAVLDPDEGDSYEGGLKSEWFNGRLNASLAYFEIRQDNRAESIGTLTNSNGMTYSAYRGTKAKTKGIELEVSGELMPGWNIQAGFTHQVIREDETNEKLTTQAPENQFKLYTTYRLPGRLSKMTIGGGGSYQGTTWRDGTDALGNEHQFKNEAFWLVNLMGRYQITNNLSATLNVNNLLDKYYYSNYGDRWTGIATKMYGEPRNMMLTTRWDF
ncbi:FpvA-like outer membrane ferropyoverdine receptor [Azotobacter vinelandii CA]|uniref:FpvA-like outer membrane ferropyoverdine receptor n=2 Tax=Azotobacter vinelandii TaxID=354 RepID=C1DGN8_AZOVD|nr:TonB-dependent siderophore receptor [Azotobacter vinelandii]ACO80534.1 FpvA-like outer membrane ferropyoverdine receptor [Azotobacter vinelandii DJ]AGK15964.1 FpvA-like outer membrane ferropyoverdine receptor [Azotobacter vinelandii CA]AGK21984.1 FpvA-like outer membrane ferropyoverdine receptor [Azotobacter vinelandii CA6]GLK58576.1 ferripyoverdine receptor [Azotobacter vinelandii]